MVVVNGVNVVGEDGAAIVRVGLVERCGSVVTGYGEGQVLEAVRVSAGKVSQCGSVLQCGIDGNGFRTIVLDHGYGKLGLVTAAHVDYGGVGGDQMREEKKVGRDEMDSEFLQAAEPHGSSHGAEDETGRSAE